MVQVQSRVFVRADAYTSPHASRVLFNDFNLSRRIEECYHVSCKPINADDRQAHKATIESLLIC